MCCLYVNNKSPDVIFDELFKKANFRKELRFTLVRKKVLQEYRDTVVGPKEHTGTNLFSFK